jgi:hypothetical protein
MQSIDVMLGRTHYAPWSALANGVAAAATLATSTDAGTRWTALLLPHSGVTSAAHAPMFSYSRIAWHEGGGGCVKRKSLVLLVRPHNA